MPLLASYQPKNAAVAVTALSVLAHKGWHITEQNSRHGFADRPVARPVRGAGPPSRCSSLDGSHNPQGIRPPQRTACGELFPDQKFAVPRCPSWRIRTWTVHAGDSSAPLAERFFTVNADNPRAMPAGELAEKLRALGCAAECCTSIPEGVAAAQGAAGYDGRVCALGTLYFSGDVRRAFEHSL